MLDFVTVNGLRIGESVTDIADWEETGQNMCKP